jgi:26S proteasome non-ATPase regulatory subunit 10
MTPLHFAADRGFNDIVAFLLDSGAPLDAVDLTGQTPLMLAVSCENTDVVRTLIARGADISKRNCDGLDVRSFEDVPHEILEILK